MKLTGYMNTIRLILLLTTLCLAAPAQAAFLSSLFGGNHSNGKYLAPDAAFKLNVSARDGHNLVADFKLAPSYYLYTNKIRFAVQDPDIKVANVSMPKGELVHDPNMGDLIELHHSFKAAISLQRNDSAARNIALHATYQGCTEKGLCYPPINKVINVSLPAAGAATAQAGNGGTAAALSGESENSRIASLFKKGSFWLIVSFFFGAGLLLAFTPCMFPMVPILSGIIVGRGHKITHAHGFILSFAYVMGMAITYAVVGVAAGLSGTLLSNALQTPWALGGFALIFVLLALSMFGLYELQLPTALQSRLTSTSNKLHGGHISGVFVMGALSAIIVGPCVAAPLAGALLYIGQTHDAFLGGSALFAMALGMGVPLMVIGASAGTLLPKAGPWMESVKRFFGVLLLAVAIWIISPIIPVATQMILWATLLILSAIYLHALDALPHTASGWHKLWKGIGVFALLLGIAYMIGALSGARDPLRPLGALGGGAVQQAAASPSLPFVRVKSLADLHARVAQANGKLVMLDYYADWCVSCKEMERFTFSDPKVRARLKNVVLLQADVTANNKDDKALLSHYELFGPPAILFFGPDGKELAAQRVTGYQNVEQFLASLRDAGV